ncbi:DUF4192 domain-containing protein [Rhodococcus artemisiae]|uniref:DUF4192 domain-containing protein n=1 Tax=Rhodococcus artemisiae TaxID=714159 RepID=A0ABU7L474_9NOCA|nr:DUF4192 domain-containing protein [Rhodococcus artemisiae]MEE2056345.1 DUF4192 domain-containing protein [Rhodococcus artemisiae]
MTASTSSSQPLHLSDIGELLAAVPAMLGFHPTRSFLVLSLSPAQQSPNNDGRGDAIGAIMRHDLLLPRVDEPIPAAMSAAFERFCTVCVREGARAVLVVLVDDRLDHPHNHASGAAVRLVEEFADELALSGIEVAGVHATPEIARGRMWFAPEGEVNGTIPDPESSVVAATRVFGGSPIRRSRNELEALLAPSPQERRRRVGQCIDDVIDARDLAYEHAARAGGADRADRMELESLLGRLAAFGDGAGLQDRECAEVAVLLANPTVRDSVLALAAGAQSRAAERMWVELARVLPDPERADAAALVAFSAYVRGDGPFAGVALGVALESNPRHRLSDLLDQALQAGLRPEAIRGLADTGYEIAARLGVVLPPPGPPE